MRFLLFLILGAIVIAVLLCLRYPVKVAKRRGIEDIWFVDLMAAIGILFFPAWLFALWYAHIAKGRTLPTASANPPQPAAPSHVTDGMEITE